jgi:hypothetical protein
MLTQSEVLRYIKSNLGFPFMFVELQDQDIIDYFTDNTRKTFSYYFPQVWKTTLNLQLEANKVPGIGNEFYLTDPQGYEIYNVVEIYTNSGDLYIHGHPPLGPLSHGDLREWALAVEMAGQLKMFSSFDMTYEFKHPNVIRISPMSNSYGTITVEYEREQPPDLSGIPNDIQKYFKELALADIKIVLGNIRKRYSGGNLRTPFGDIPIEGDIKEDGQNEKDKLIELFDRTFIPNVRVDHG